MKPNEQKPKTAFSKNFILPIVLIIVIFGLVLILQSIEKELNNQPPYTPDDTEIEVRDDIDSNQLPQSSGPGEINMSQELGPATVDDLIGGTAAEEFYQTPSIEKLLEGKEIEVNTQNNTK